MAMPTHTDEAIRSDTWLPPKSASPPKIGITIANSATRTNNGISEITGVGFFVHIIFLFIRACKGNHNAYILPLFSSIFE